MKKTITILSLLLCVAATQKAMAYSRLAIPDSIASDPEDEDYFQDTIARKPKNIATGKSAMDFSLEKRYRPQNEEFTKRWYDHMFLEGGMGFLGMAASFEDYKLNTVTSMHFGIGKTFGKYHTVRLSLAGGTGYEEYSKKRFYMAHGKADYLFNMTAFSRGYDPARHFEVSLLLGGGAMYTKLQNMSKRVSPEFHGGLQFKFVAGPYGHFIVEPYAGITQDKMDASSDKNWRRYDIFYGVNLGIVHNLTNNYAPRQRADSLRRAPWFVEASMGPVAASRKGMPISTLPAKETVGLQMSWAVGKWLSPAIGLKFSAFMASNRMSWEKAGKDRMTNDYTTYCGGNLEAMFNPFGFSRRFSWDAPFGAYLLGGLGYGSINITGAGRFHKTVSFESVSVGAHLFASIDKDLQFFVEPRYARYQYRAGSLGRDRTASVLFGLTAMMRGAKYRPHHLLEPEDATETFPITAGLSFTMPVMMMQVKAMDDKGFSYGVKAFGQYRFTDVSSARLSVDYLSISRAAYSSYLDEYVKDGNTVSQSRSGIMNRRHGLLIATADYCVDVCRLLSGYQGPRRFRAELYFGPGAAFYLSDNVSAPSGMEIPEGHAVKNKSGHKVTTHFAFTGGVKLSHNFSRNIGIYLEPSLHAVAKLKMPGIQTISFVSDRMQLIPSVSLGAQYTL